MNWDVKIAFSVDYTSVCMYIQYLILFLGSDNGVPHLGLLVGR